MSRTPQQRAARTLLWLTALLVALSVWTFWPGQSSTPRLGLDLRGGTQVTLTPRVTSGTISDTQLKQAVEIIRQRVNGLGVAEAEVSIQGNGPGASILVSVPGVSEQGIANVLKQTALLDFRPVEQEVSGVPNQGDADATLVAPVQAATSAELQEALASLDCSNPAARQGGVAAEPTNWVVTCSTDGVAKYLLQPAFIQGTMIADAQAAIPQGGIDWQVTLDFDSEGSAKLAEASQKLYVLPSPQNQFAIVLDGLVFSSPYFSEPILGGQASITGSFTQAQASDLANVLKYGALPLTLDLAEVTTLSPTLGQDQLDAGILAGLLGLGFVALYLLFYYRGLGIVAGLSLVVAALATYVVFVLMGRVIGFTLTLAGVAGAIVAVGITADSFVVYFERIRDEIREGKPLRSAISAGWIRARRTLLAADAISLLAAVVLYWLSIGSVRGFAFALGVTTLIDVAVAFWFTHPVVELLGRTKAFTAGASWTGLDPRRLGVTSISAPHARSVYAPTIGE